jgi:hypothetical protein
MIGEIIFFRLSTNIHSFRVTSLGPSKKALYIKAECTIFLESNGPSAKQCEESVEKPNTCMNDDVIFSRHSQRVSVGCPVNPRKLYSGPETENDYQI